MKKAKLDEYRKKTKDELGKILVEKRLEVMRVQPEVLTKKEKNLKKAKSLRLDIARLSTIIREKESDETLSNLKES